MKSPYLAPTPDLGHMVMSAGELILKGIHKCKDEKVENLCLLK